MLSYRHAFHAGNFTDVHKHVALVMLLEHLLRKDAPFCCLDTHAGAGVYDLDSRYAQRNREFETGIARLWGRSDCPAPVARYVDIVRGLNPPEADGTLRLRWYPGSTWIARTFLRPADRIVASELHSTDAPMLKQCFARDLQVSTHHRDGFEILPALVPPRERRGLVVMDPSYEVRNEFARVVETLGAAWHKWPTGIYLLWYPVQRRQPLAQFHHALKRGGMRKVLMNELSVEPDVAPNRLSGSGLIVVNPPWQFEAEFRIVTRWLERALERGTHPPARSRWLVPE